MSDVEGDPESIAIFWVERERVRDAGVRLSHEPPLREELRQRLARDREFRPPVYHRTKLGYRLQLLTFGGAQSSELNRWIPSGRLSVSSDL